jgi:hypothetical protein
VPGPPSGNHDYVITISIPGPLTREEITQLNATIRKCLGELGKDAVCSEQKIVPKKC